MIAGSVVALVNLGTAYTLPTITVVPRIPSYREINKVLCVAHILP